MQVTTDEKNLADELTADDVIDNLGGTCAVAQICNINPASVSMWRAAPKSKGGRRYSAVEGIPKPWFMFLQEKHPEAFQRRANGA